MASYSYRSTDSIVKYLFHFFLITIVNSIGSIFFYKKFFSSNFIILYSTSIFSVYYNIDISTLNKTYLTSVFSDLFRSILNLHRHFKYVKKLSNEKVLDIRELDENFLTYYKIPRYIEWYNRPFSSIIICWFHPLSLWLWDSSVPLSFLLWEISIRFMLK